MTVARAAVLGLAVLAILTLVPGWPRHSWRTSSPRHERSNNIPRPLPISDRRRRFGVIGPAAVACVAGGSTRGQPGGQPVATADRPAELRSGAGPSAVPESRPAASPGTVTNWSSLLVAAYSWCSCVVRLATPRRGAGRAPVPPKSSCAEPLASDAPGVPLDARSVAATPPEQPDRSAGRSRTPAADDLACRSGSPRSNRRIVSEQRWLMSPPTSRTAISGCWPCAVYLLLLFYAQPLFWLLRRQIRLDQEMLADAAAASTNRTHYAQILLDWARTMSTRPAGFRAAALGLWERPSQLRRRIALVARSRPGDRTSLAARLAVGHMGRRDDDGSGALLGSLRPVSSRLEPGVAEAEPATTKDNFVSFQGRVVDPDGKPHAGARLYLDYFVWKEYAKAIPPRLRATTGPDGRFQFRVEKSYFARPPLIDALALGARHSPGRRLRSGRLGFRRGGLRSRLDRSLTP